MKKNITIVPKTRIATANKLGIDQTYQHDLIVDKSPLINVLKSRAIGISYAGAFKKLLDAYEESKQYIFVSQRKENVELLLDYVDNFHRDIKEEID
ncbi:MAG: hypothetical protein KKD77_21465, partial [Gammaproteobacteria bacterium]|nr:hypothetical protein [Gammaproteobacteria bacterium]